MQTTSILPFHFLVITFCGAWCPAHWSTIKKYLYHLYTSIAFAIMYSITILQLGQLVFGKLTIEDLNDTLYPTIANISATSKFTCCFIQRDKISQLIDMFQIESCHARDDLERSLKQKYDSACKGIGKALLLLVEIDLVTFVLSPLTQDEPRKLAYEALQVYDMSSPLVYGLSYAHHTCAAFLFGSISIISDATVAGFMSQVCCQLDKISHRLANFPSQVRQMCQSSDNAAIVETHLLKDHIKYHIHIYNLAESMMSTFSGIIMTQFYVGTVLICLSVYQLIFGVSNVVEKIKIGFFCLCMLLELTIYCYFGNELADKSVDLRDSIYDIDWTSLTTITQKNLAFMICRASKPIEFNKGAFIQLTMETFASVIKMSYSVFSVIKSSR